MTDSCGTCCDCKTNGRRWRGSCWSALVELRDYRIDPYRNRSYRVAIDLTGLGTFLDIHGGLDSMSPR